MPPDAPHPPADLFPMEGIVRRPHREALLRQHGLAVWMTGLSGAGKTSLAHEVQRRLHLQQRLVAVLDGDGLRSGLTADLGFTEADRTENIRRVAEMARLFVDTGVVAVVSTISPTHAMRALARSIVGDADFLEVFVHRPLAACEALDVKGLYARARAGALPNFTGIDSPFEEPLAPDVEIRTDQLPLDQCAALLMAQITARIAPH